MGMSCGVWAVAENLYHYNPRVSGRHSLFLGWLNVVLFSKFRIGGHLSLKFPQNSLTSLGCGRLGFQTERSEQDTDLHNLTQ